MLRPVRHLLGRSTIEAAEAITGADLDTLDLLVAKSLLVRGERSGATRLTMLETVRECATERLDRAKDLQEIAERHAQFFLGLARREGSAPCVMGSDSASTALDWTSRQITSRRR